MKKNAARQAPRQLTTILYLESLELVGVGKADAEVAVGSDVVGVRGDPGVRGGVGRGGGAHVVHFAEAPAGVEHEGSNLGHAERVVDAGLDEGVVEGLVGGGRSVVLGIGRPKRCAGGDIDLQSRDEFGEAEVLGQLGLEVVVGVLIARAVCVGVIVVELDVELGAVASARDLRQNSGEPGSGANLI